MSDPVIPGGKRSRGRPPTTGAYERKKKRKEERAKEEKEKLEGEIADILRGVADLLNPKPTKAAQRWQMKEEEEMEYVRTASTQEIADILLDKTARMQAAVCASGDLGG